MKLLNCDLCEAIKILSGKRIIFFGAGRWLSTVNHTELMMLEKQFDYIVDNGEEKEYKLGELFLPIYGVEKLLHERNCVIILSSPVYMYEMFEQLCSMEIDESVECYSFPFMQMVTPNKMSADLLNDVVCSEKISKIPKIIHSFWFSGEEKPYAYQKCIDSWRRVLVDYEIIEWNCENYNWEKHPFVKDAINKRAWAYASDYARLDVLNEIGGIYLDMDVEVFKPFDDLLSNDAILSFSNHIQIDLAVVGAKKGNELIRKLLNLYDVVEIPETREEYVRFFQPAFVRDELVKNGVRMNGSLQKLDNATCFPPCFFMPLDAILYREYVKTDQTYCVHMDNFGWSYSGDDKRKKKITENNALWKRIEG